MSNSVDHYSLSLSRGYLESQIMTTVYLMDKTVGE